MMSRSTATVSSAADSDPPAAQPARQAALHGIDQEGDEHGPGNRRRNGPRISLQQVGEQRERASVNARA
jgi:hypothetical protein